MAKWLKANHRRHATSRVKPTSCECRCSHPKSARSSARSRRRDAIWLTEVAPHAGKEVPRPPEERQRRRQPRTDAPGAEARHRRRQDHRHGHAHRLADHQRRAPPGSKKFTRGFLIVAPGLTIKDRLRVLQPNDPDSYYARAANSSRRHAGRHQAPRSSSPTTTPSSCASAWSSPKGGRAAAGARARRSTPWKPKAR
jgi:hypothetical protein